MLVETDPTRSLPVRSARTIPDKTRETHQPVQLRKYYLQNAPGLQEVFGV